MGVDHCERCVPNFDDTAIWSIEPLDKLYQCCLSATACTDNCGHLTCWYLEADTLKSKIPVSPTVTEIYTFDCYVADIWKDFQLRGDTKVLITPMMYFIESFKTYFSILVVADKADKLAYRS